MNDIDDLMTLDPPGSIAVVGAGPLGVEAALYGRFLGYNVTLIEAGDIGQALRVDPQLPLPMLPDRCLSPLASSALDSQRHASAAQKTLPTTCGEWIKQVLQPLTESDLLRGRLRRGHRVERVEQVDVQLDPEDEPGDIPPDFRLTMTDPEGQRLALDAEAVVLAIGPSGQIETAFEPPVPYYWRIGAETSKSAEDDFVNGLRAIVRLFAQLGGRADLDLYRPRRV